MKGLNVPYFLHLFPPPSIKVGLVGLLRKKVKQYPVFYDKQIKEYREKDAVNKVWSVGTFREMLLHLYTRLNCVNQSVNLTEVQLI